MTLPWYPRDMGKYARDTKHLTMLEHGAYNLLLDYYYSTGSLPSTEQCSSNATLLLDHSRIYRVCAAMKKEEQEAVDNVISMFFKLKKSFYIHERCDEVIEEQEQKHQRRVNAGKSNSKAMLKQCSSNTPQTKTKTKTKKPPTPLKGNGVDSYFLGSLSDEALDRARKNAPGWDINHLVRIYDQGIKDGIRQAPRNINAAFPTWCTVYTKGKTP